MDDGEVYTQHGDVRSIKYSASSWLLLVFCLNSTTSCKILQVSNHGNKCIRTHYFWVLNEQPSVSIDKPPPIAAHYIIVMSHRLLVDDILSLSVSPSYMSHKGLGISTQSGYHQSFWGIGSLLQKAAGGPSHKEVFAAHLTSQGK